MTVHCMLNSAGGGVAIYIQDHLTYSVRPDVSLFDQDLGSLFIEIDGREMDDKKNIILGVIYRLFLIYRPAYSMFSLF